MTENTAILLWVLAGLLVVVGLAGTILPALPGVPFVFMGLLIAAWIGDFQRIAWPTLAVLAVLTALAIAERPETSMPMLDAAYPRSVSDLVA